MSLIQYFNIFPVHLFSLIKIAYAVTCVLCLMSFRCEPCKRCVILSLATLWVVVGRTAIVSHSSSAVLRAEQAQHS